MRAKLILTNKYGITMNYGGKQSNDSKKIKKINFVHKDVHKILSSHKISKKYITKKAVLKNFSRKNLCWSLFFNKNAGLLKNICERLLLRVFHFMLVYQLINYLESSHWRFSVRKGVLQNSQENTCVRPSFLIKLPAASISKNTFFTEYCLVTAS